MSKILEAKPEHFKSIYRILQKFNNPNISMADWEKLFTHKWSYEKPFGYVLVSDDEEIVGFIGTIYSNRNINGKSELFCNLSSWIVLEEYRKESLYLALKVLQDRDCSIVVYTATKEVSPIWSKLGLKPMEEKYKIIFLPTFTFKNNPLVAITKPNEICKKLSSTDLQIFNDHTEYKCQHIILYEKENTEKYCYIIFNRTKIKGVAFCHVHYISDKMFFQKHLSKIRLELFKYSKTPFALIPNRFFIKNISIFPSYNYTFKPAKLFYRSSAVAPQYIDNLYSELILLNM